MSADSGILFPTNTLTGRLKILSIVLLLVFDVRHGPLHPSSLQSPGSGGASSVVYSPKSIRDYDMPGASSAHLNTESIVPPSSGSKLATATREEMTLVPKKYGYPRCTIHRPRMITARTCGSHTRIVRLSGGTC